MNPALPDMSMRIRSAAASKTTRIFELALDLSRKGRDIISLSVGEPDFATPQPIIQATSKALEDQATRYGPVAGLPALRQQLAKHQSSNMEDSTKDAHAEDICTADNILVTNGAKQALYSLFQILCDPGSEIIVPIPCWVSFSEQIKLAGGIPVLVPTPNHQLNPDAIEKAISPMTRAILVNSPNNPTGAVYDAESLGRIARLAEEHNLYLISDEAYQQIFYGDSPPVAMAGLVTTKERVITVGSFSKHYNMTGFRIGYVVAHKKIIQSLIKLQGHTTGNVCTFAQHGALAALAMDQSIVVTHRASLARRRDLAFGCVSELFPCVNAQGAFYLFADVSQHLGPDETSEDFSLMLLERAGVAVVPGEAFHGPGHVRISFAINEDRLQEAFDRIRAVL